MARELAETIVERAFLVLSNGIAAELQRQGVWTGEDDQRHTIFSTARIVLYQLLFLVFAEGRGLLPLTHPVYSKHSLHNLIQQIANQAFLPLHERYSFEADDFWVWDYVQALLIATQHGRPDWNVSPYGRAISSEDALADVRIGACYLIETLDLLGRNDDARAATTPEAACCLRDYSVMDVRLLGDIYERLLACELEEAIHHRNTETQNAPKNTNAVPVCLCDSIFTLRSTRTGRRASGSFYTPRYLVSSLVEETIGPLLAERIAQFDATPTPETCTALLDLSLLDPAMGCGTFLLTSVELLVARLLKILDQAPTGPLAVLLTQMRAMLQADNVSDAHLLHHLILQKCIYGVDIDKCAVEIARLSLWLYCCIPGTPLDALDGRLRCANSLIGGQLQALYEPSFIPPGLATGLTLLRDALPTDDLRGVNSAYEQSIASVRQLLDLSVSRLLSGIKDANLLAKNEQQVLDQAHVLAARHRFFHWELAFPAVFFDIAHQVRKQSDQAGFDAIVGNPPYVTTLDRQERAYFMAWSTSRGRELDASYLFVEQALSLLRPGGRCGLVLPSVWMLQSEAEMFRRHLLDQTIISLCDLGFTIFSATVPVATLVFAHCPPSSTHTIRLRLRDGLEQTVPQAVFAVLPAAQFNVYLADMLPLLQRIQAISSPLDTYAESHEGVHSGNIRHKLFTRTPTPFAKPLLKGADIGRYSLQWSGWYVNYDPALINRSGGEYASLRDERIFTRPKIWTRQTGDRIIATWDEQGFYSDNTLHSTQIRPGINLAPLYLVALLNSRLLTFIYQQYTQEQGRPLAQVKLVFLRQLPIRRISFTTPKEERARLVEAGMFAAVVSPSGGQAKPPEGGTTRLLTAFRDTGIDLAEQSDVVHDLLVVLARQMLDLKQRHAIETTAFFDWLATATGSSVSGWIGKRLLYTYWMHPWHTIQQTLQRNMSAATLHTVLPAIQARWEASCAMLAPLHTAIQATDHLIDLLVYRLYDLSDEEVALIEVDHSKVT